MSLDDAFLTMTVDELKVEFVALAQAYAAIGNQRQELWGYIKQREAEVAALPAVDGLSELGLEELQRKVATVASTRAAVTTAESTSIVSAGQSI